MKVGLVLPLFSGEPERVIAFVIEYLRQRDWRPSRVNWSAFAILLVPSGLISFMAFSAFRFHDPPLPLATVDNCRGNPLPISSRISLVPAKNATDRLLGDQNG